MIKKIAFGDRDITKHKFHYHKNLIPITDEDITKISNKVSFGKKGFKYFIGYKYNENVKPLSLMLPKMGGYTKFFNETKYMSFLIKDDQLLEKYNKILDKVKQ